MQSAAPRVLSGIAALAPDYDLLLCDVWGVVHNGETAYPEAVNALHHAREGGATVILITNAPRPGAVIEKQIAGYSVPRACFDTVVASGDVAREELRRWPGVKLFHLGPERDLPNYEGLDLRLVGFDEADMVVCTGLFDDTVETPDDYRDMLAKIHVRLDQVRVRSAGKPRPAPHQSRPAWPRRNWNQARTRACRPSRPSGTGCARRSPRN
jgi:ribonucleotide monophosphatase NagD (HAD superfamily)